MSATNPNEPTYPYSGGTDNPGGNTSTPGGPSNYAATETGAPATALLFPPINGIPGASDTHLAPGMQAVPAAGGGWEAPDDTELASDTGGAATNPDGTVRAPGQDETAGETETTSGESPAAFPEPTP